MEGLYHCDLCDFTTKNQNYMPRHKILMHSNKQDLTCKLCSQVYTPSILYLHTTLEHRR